MWQGIAIAIACLGAAVPRLYEAATSSHWRLEFGPLPTAIVVAAAAVAAWLGAGRAAAAFVGGAPGVVLFAKPWIQPVLHDTGAFGFTSETHLYYVVPGLLLALLGLALAVARPPASRRTAAVAVAATGAVAAFVLLGTFFVGRGGAEAAVSFFAPGLASAIVSVITVARLPVDLAPAFATTAVGFAPSALGAATDPSLHSLVRAVAHAPAPLPHPAALVGARIGPFELVEVLGAGGMGHVYRARDHRLLRDVALKVLPPDLAHDPARRERLLREARAAGRITHPNVAALHDVHLEGGLPFLVLELCAGRTLRTLAERERITPARAAAIALQIADGLAAAHALGIVHRDLKPENVVVDDADRVKVLDFGLARPGLDETPTGSLTEEGAVLGTPAYMSPEQASGRPVDLRSDVFSFGIVLGELVTGRSPFLRPTVGATRLAVMDVALPPGWLDEIPPPLHEIVATCLAREPDRRHADAAAIAAALRAAPVTAAAR
jgi:protein kinase-like protein